MELLITIRPAVDPMSRGKIEYAAVLAAGSTPDQVDGGTMVDGSASEVAVTIPSENVIPKIRAALEQLRFSGPVTFEFSVLDEGLDG